MIRPRQSLVAGSLVVAALVVGGCASGPLAGRGGAKESTTPIVNEAAVSDFEARRDESELQAALNRWQAGDPSECREILDQLLARNPDHYEANLLSAELWLEQDRPRDAIAQFRRCGKLRPQDSRIEHGQAVACEALGDISGAALHRRRAAELFAAQADASPGSEPRAAGDSAPLDVGPRFDPHVLPTSTARLQGSAAESPLSLAVATLAAGQPAQAAQFVESALLVDPDSAPLHRVLGVARYRLGDYPAAEAALARSIALDKSNALSYFLLGRTLEKLGKGPEAERNYDRARALDARFAGPR